MQNNKQKLQDKLLKNRQSAFATQEQTSKQASAQRLAAYQAGERAEQKLQNLD